MLPKNIPRMIKARRVGMPILDEILFSQTHIKIIIPIRMRKSAVILSFFADRIGKRNFSSCKDNKKDDYWEMSQRMPTDIFRVTPLSFHALVDASSRGKSSYARQSGPAPPYRR